MTTVPFAAARAAVVREAYGHGVDLMEMYDAVYECPCHGSLDCVNRTWPVPVPDLMTTLKTSKEAAVQTTEAPFGYKADGVTPRLRPAPPATSLAKARAVKAAKRTAALEQSSSVAVLPEPDPAPEPENVDPLEVALDELETKIEAARKDVERLYHTRDELRELEATIEDAEAEAERLTRARDALGEVVERSLAVAA